MTGKILVFIAKILVISMPLIVLLQVNFYENKNHFSSDKDKFIGKRV